MISFAKFVDSIEDGEKFYCPKDSSKHEGNFVATVDGETVKVYGSKGAATHGKWCQSFRLAYGIVPKERRQKKTTKGGSVRQAVTAKPSREEDRALRGSASKGSTIRRDSKQVERPVGEQKNGKQKFIKVTGGYVDPATMPPDSLVDKNGRDLFGKAKRLRINKLIREGSVQLAERKDSPKGKKAAKKAAKQSDSNEVAKEVMISSEAAVLEDGLTILEGKVSKIEDFVKMATPTLKGLQEWLESQQQAAEDFEEALITS